MRPVADQQTLVFTSSGEHQWGICAGLAVPAVAWLSRPAERGAPHTGYFQQLSSALREAGLAHACWVLDLARARSNIAAIGEHQNKNGMSLRAVLDGSIWRYRRV